MSICTHRTSNPERGEVTKQQVRRGRQAADVSPTQQSRRTQQHRDTFQSVWAGVSRHISPGARRWPRGERRLITLFGKTTDSAPSILPASKRIRRKRPAAPLIQRLRSSGELAGFRSWAQLQSRGRRQRPRPQPEEEAGQALPEHCSRQRAGCSSSKGSA